MEEMWKRIMAAVVLSVLLPQAVLNIGSRMYARQPEPSETVAATAATQPTTQPTGVAQTLRIPVLTAENGVQLMELEDYVRGAVIGEMPATFGMEALKAQAVAARTFALRRLTLRDKHPEGAVCTDPNCCQAWQTDAFYLSQWGTRQDWEKIAAAVEETAGLVVTYDGSLAETTYFSCSGGRTESAAAVWGQEIPYLQSVDSPGEEWATVFSAEICFTKAEFSACLGRELSGSPMDWLGKVTYSEGGGVAAMVIGGISYSGVELRALLGLNSTVFSMMAGEEGITVTTRGHGHRVGMSQYGADAMADRGCDFEEILLYYYQGTKIDKISEME